MGNKKLETAGARRKCGNRGEVLFSLLFITEILKHVCILMGMTQ